MALPSSGTISISQIRTELGNSSGSLRTLSAAAGKSTPDAMSEFWGYSAITYTWNGMWWLDNPCSGTTYLYYGSDGNYYKTNDFSNYINVNYQFFNSPSYEDAGGWFYSLYRAIPGTSIYNNYYGDTFSYCAPF